MDTFDKLSAAFVENSLPSTEDCQKLQTDSGVDIPDIKWFFLKVRHLVNENSINSENHQELSLYLDSLKFIYCYGDEHITL